MTEPNAREVIMGEENCDASLRTAANDDHLDVGHAVDERLPFLRQRVTRPSAVPNCLDGRAVEASPAAFLNDLASRGVGTIGQHSRLVNITRYPSITEIGLNLLPLQQQLRLGC